MPSPAWPNFVGAIAGRRRDAGAGADDARSRQGQRAAGTSTSSASRPRSRRAPALHLRQFAVQSDGLDGHAEELQAILDLARTHGLWIIADEIYGRFVYDGAARAPSFHDIMDEEDRILFVQTFSKNWAMTGWRIGWLECHPAFGQTVENLMQYSSLGRAGLHPARGQSPRSSRARSFVAAPDRKARARRDIVCPVLARHRPRAFAPPAGAFYLFFSVEGEHDTRRSRSGWSTRPLWASRRARRSARAARTICACASPGSPTDSRKPPAGSRRPLAR